VRLPTSTPAALAVTPELRGGRLLELGLLGAAERCEQAREVIAGSTKATKQASANATCPRRTDTLEAKLPAVRPPAPR
jgi:hypothetical protein